MLFNSAIWVIAAAAIGVIARPWNSPEFVWPIARVATLMMFGDLTVGRSMRKSPAINGRERGLIDDVAATQDPSDFLVLWR
jgi:hypothetical protein